MKVAVYQDREIILYVKINSDWDYWCKNNMLFERWEQGVHALAENVCVHSTLLFPCLPLPALSLPLPCPLLGYRCIINTPFEVYLA